jgi:acylphosphatase
MWALASVLTGGFALVLLSFHMLTRQNRGLEQAVVEVSEDGEEVKIVTRGTPKYAARLDAWLEWEFPSRPSAVTTYWASEEEGRGSEQFEAGMSRNLSRPHHRNTLGV